MARQQDRLVGDDFLHREGRFATAAASPAVAAETEQIPVARVSSPGKDAWRRFRRNWAAMLSLAVILILSLAAIFAPLLHTMSPTTPDFTVPTYSGPSASHWFGTDGGGYDEYSRIVFGLRIPLIIGVVGAVITTVLGALIGVIAGYAGGWLDSLLARFTDLVFAFPAFLLAVLCAEYFGSLLDNSSINNYLAGGGRVIILTIVFAAVGWPFLMRFVRSLALSLKQQQFVEAARTSGSSSWRILVRHLLPNMYGLILVQAGFIVVNFIYTEAVISILGLGVQPPNPDLGVMLAHGPEAFGFTYWLTIFPSIFITLLILGFTFLGDGVRDAVDPRGSQ